MNQENISYRLFVYGSLKDPLLFRDVTGIECPRKSNAVLKGFGLSQAVDGGPVIYPNEKGSIIGELIYDLPEEILKTIDQYEDIEKRSIQRQEITVLANHQIFNAYTYVGIEPA